MPKRKGNSELRALIAEAYQVIGVLAQDAGRFDDVWVIKAMDNLAAGRLMHSDVLPFPCKRSDGAQPVANHGFADMAQCDPAK